MFSQKHERLSMHESKLITDGFSDYTTTLRKIEENNLNPIVKKTLLNDFIKRQTSLLENTDKPLAFDKPHALGILLDSAGDEINKLKDPSWRKEIRQEQLHQIEKNAGKKTSSPTSFWETCRSSLSKSNSRNLTHAPDKHKSGEGQKMSK